ncbi:MAG TPA: hypothetical protein VMW15_15280 [Terracidiphilus sp.]|nr:hypothetical protein [Terracidiphilus sp.]
MRAALAARVARLARLVGLWRLDDLRLLADNFLADVLVRLELFFVELGAAFLLPAALLPLLAEAWECAVAELPELCPATGCTSIRIESRTARN